MSKVACFKRLPSGEWITDAEMEARCATVTLLLDGDDYYARELVVAASEAYVKRVRCDDVIRSRQK